MPDLRPQIGDLLTRLRIPASRNFGGIRAKVGSPM